MKWEHAVQRFSGRQGLGAWAVFAQGGNAQHWLQHQEKMLHLCAAAWVLTWQTVSNVFKRRCSAPLVWAF